VASGVRMNVELPESAKCRIENVGAKHSSAVLPRALVKTS
jgi:hypothetical protein